ncbi:MAG: alpha-amylase, partial [Gemmatimonadetes bacterium]|nr:alpha-amylase [Gemmatimonadota bacterium]
YAFGACFSSGVMMPMGYEYGFRKSLDVVKTRPEDWEEPLFDLSGFIGEVNRMKAGSAVLNEEGPQERLTATDEPVLALLRRASRDGEAVFVVANTDRRREHALKTERLHG